MWSPMPGAEPSPPAGAAIAALTERKFLVTAFGDLVGRPPEMRAVAIVAQNATHGPAFDVAIDAVLPGIDLERQQCFARLDDDPRPLVHVSRPGLNMSIVVLLHEPQRPHLAFDAVRDGLRNIAARGMRPQYHQHVGEAFRE